MECRNCEGTGVEEVFSGCLKPAWDCCGGCMQKDTCFVCEGSGELRPPCNDYDTIRLFNVHERLLNHPVKHGAWIEAIESEVYEFIYQQQIYKI